MRRLALTLGLTLLATSAFAHGRSINIDEDTFGDCNATRISFDGERAAIERVELPASGLRSLKVRTGNGPLSIRGGNAWSIVACKAAEDASALRNVDVRLSGDELSASGNGEHDWTVVFYITTPRGADLTVDTSNGPVSLRDVDGDLKLHTRNGPLTLHNVSGHVDADAQNGPIGLRGGSGTISVRAQNGPLTVNLDGASFNGTLEASTKNGPLSVRIPRGYASGVLVEALGHGPVSCHAEGCREARAKMRNDDDDDWNQPRSFSFGSGPQNVKVSTVNGPVTIRETGSEDD
jgi:DUF4097 and DUF4098 domain-containing protein YvlB